MIAGPRGGLRRPAIWALVPKGPVLYSLRNKQPPERRGACAHKAVCRPRAHPRPRGQCWGSPCEGYSLFLGTGLYGGPFLPWCTRQTRCPLPNTRWLKPAGDPHAAFSNPLPTKTNPACQQEPLWNVDTTLAERSCAKLLCWQDLTGQVCCSGLPWGLMARQRAI